MFTFAIRRCVIVLMVICFCLKPLFIPSTLSPPPLSPHSDAPAGAQSALRRRLPLHLRRRVQEGGAALHGGQHPADAVLRRQHPHPVSLPPPLRQGG